MTEVICYAKFCSPFKEKYVRKSLNHVACFHHCIDLYSFMLKGNKAFNHYIISSMSSSAMASSFKIKLSQVAPKVFPKTDRSFLPSIFQEEKVNCLICQKDVKATTQQELKYS